MADINFDLKGLQAYYDLTTKLGDRVTRVQRLIAGYETEIQKLRDAQMGGKITADQFNDALDQLRKKQERSRGSLEKLKDTQRAMNKAQREVSRIFPKQIKDYKAYSAHLQEIKKSYEDQVDAISRTTTMSDKMYQQMISDVEKFKDKLAEVSSEPVRLTIEADSKDVDKARKARRELVEKAGGAGRGVLGSIGSITGVKSKTMSGAADSFKSVWEGGKNLQDSFRGLSSILGAAGKGAGVFTGALNLLGKAFMSNPIGLIVGALAAVGSVINDLDKMIKGLNKSWREMAGAPVLLKNVRASMKEFNDSIYNLGRNMRLGLKASDITEFFKTMSSAGLTTEGVAKRVSSFNEAIETGFKLSRNFGVTFSEMGTMTANQMLTLRSSLDEVSDSFQKMAYDAAVAGVQSQKFYQVVENASASLSFYGNFLDSTSARLRDFMQTGVMGFKDAAQTVQDLAGTFKGMGMDQRRAIVNLIGEDEVRRMFEEREKEMNKQIQELADKSTQLRTLDPKAFAAAKMRLQAMKGDLRNLREARSTGDVTALGSMLEVLSDKVMGAAAKVLERTGVDFFKDKAAAFAVLQEKFSWNIDMVNKSFKKANVAMDIMKHSADGMREALKKAPKEVKGEFEDIAKTVRDYASDPITSGFNSFEDMLESVRKRMKEAGIDDKLMTPLLDLLNLSEEGFSDFLDTLLGKTSKKFGQIATSISIGTKAREKEGELPDKQMDALIKQTTPLADYLEIGKENAKYALAGSDLMENISVAAAETARKVSGIASVVTRWFQSSQRKRTDTQKESFRGDKRANFEALVAKATMLKGVIAEKRQRGELAGTEEEMLKGTQNEIEKWKKEFDMVPDLLEEARLVGMELGEDRVKELMKYKAKYDESIKVLDELWKKEKDKVELERKSTIVMERANRAAQAYNEVLDQVEKATPKALVTKVGDEPDKRGRLSEVFRSGSSATDGALGAADLTADDFALKKRKDFYAKSGGIVNVSKGDYVIAGEEIAKGLGMGRGQLANFGPGIMKGPAGGGSRAVSIGNVQLNFNAPVNGNPEEYRRMFEEAVNDVVNKRMYEDKKRG